MPVYEYLCQACGLRFEKVQSFNAAPLTDCPNCGGSVQRVIQPVGVIFKGSGFYVTDNRGKSSTMPSTKRDGDKGTTASSESPAGDSVTASAAKSSETD
jgi:putative FmdB family regulatory protein